MTYDWQDSFNGKCDELKSEYIDQGIQQMVSSRENGELIAIIQEPINALIEKVKDLEKQLNIANEKINKFSMGENTTMPQTNTIDATKLENLLALAKSHEVNRSAASLAYIPVVETKDKSKKKSK